MANDKPYIRFANPQAVGVFIIMVLETAFCVLSVLECIGGSIPNVGIGGWRWIALTGAAVALVYFVWVQMVGGRVSLHNGKPIYMRENWLPYQIFGTIYIAEAAYFTLFIWIHFNEFGERSKLTDWAPGDLNAPLGQALWRSRHEQHVMRIFTLFVGVMLFVIFRERGPKLTASYRATLGPEVQALLEG